MESVSTDTEHPGDLFVALYDALGDEPFRTQQVGAWRKDDWVNKTAEEVEAEVVESGCAPRQMVDQILRRGPIGTFALLQGLDFALEHVDARHSDADQVGHLYGVLAHYLDTGRLNTRLKDGLLLFRLASPGRPTTLPDRSQYFGVVRVPPELLSIVDYDVVKTHWDLQIEAATADRDPWARVACVPMIDGYHELEIVRREDGPDRFYRITPRTAPLAARIPTVLDRLDRSGAVIAILPEVSLSDELLDAWKEALRSKPRPAGCRLRWLIVGSGPVGGSEPPFNRAVMLLRQGGHEILTYDKHFDFTLSARQVARWRLEQALGPGPRMEDITRGNSFVVRECALGRVAILICEDLGRIVQCSPALATFGVTHLLVPVFSAPLAPRSWENRSGREIVEHLGAAVVVVNSRAVGRAMGIRDPMRVCASVAPMDDDRSEYQLGKPKLRRTSRPDAVLTLEVPPGEIKRYQDLAP